VRPELASVAAPRVPINRWIAFAAIALAGAAADLATKQVVFRWLGVAPDFLLPGSAAAAERWRGDRQLAHLWWLWQGRLGVQTSINTGALFGMGAGWWWIFALLSVAALIGIVTWLFYYGAARDRWLTVALACVTAGILGNLYDRLGLWDSAGLRPEFQHGVRDWILFVWPEVKLRIFNPWPNFNIADSLLVTGAILLAIHSLVWPRPLPEDRASAASQSTRTLREGSKN
jgi:signal peptidase II